MASKAGSVAELGTVGLSKLLHVGLDCGFIVHLQNRDWTFSLQTNLSVSVCVGVREVKVKPQGKKISFSQQDVKGN